MMKGFYLWKCKFYKLCVGNLVSRLLQIAYKWKKDNDVAIFVTWRHRHFFWFCFILLSSLVAGPSFMSISSLVLELWQFSFIRDWPKIRKSEIPPYQFCLISADWGKLGVQNSAQIFLMKCYWLLQNARVTAFNFLELLRKNQQGGKVKLLHTHIQR